MRPKDLSSVYSTQVEAAQAIGVSKQAITAWIKRKQIPLEHQVKFEIASEGKLRADGLDEICKLRRR